MPHPAVLGFSRRLRPDLLAIAEPAADTHTHTNSIIQKYRVVVSIMNLSRLPLYC